MHEEFNKYTSIIDKLSLSDDDKIFLAQKFEQFPRVREGFEQFTNTHPFQRIQLAGSILNTQPRTGWLRFNIAQDPKDILATRAKEYKGSSFLMFEEVAPVVETVLEHSAEAGDLYALIYKGFDTPTELQWGNDIMKFHDFAEAIIGDFTPNDPIAREDKIRLEGIAIDLLTQSRDHGDLLALHIYHCLQIYEGNITDFEITKRSIMDEMFRQESEGLIKSHQTSVVAFFRGLYNTQDIDLERLRTQTKDIDVLQMSVRGVRIIHDGHAQRPEFEARQEMQEFWKYIDKKLETEQARGLFNELKYLYDNEPEMASNKVIPLACFLMENAPVDMHRAELR
ncbi:MAG: hypothetical protein JKY11_03725 [Alphaproteobacteria bacterium]|nr:hypothetical protein [Alphaproteobacteria bacterium]